MGIDGPIESLEIVAKYAVDNLTSRESPARFPYQQYKQPDLCWSEVNLGFTYIYGTFLCVYRDWSLGQT